MGQRIETVAMLQGVDRGGLATRVPKPPEVSPRARGAGSVCAYGKHFRRGQPARAWGGVGVPADILSVGTVRPRARGALSPTAFAASAA